MTPEFHRGEGFSSCLLGPPWSFGRLLNMVPTKIPAAHQVLHLRISLRIQSLPIQPPCKPELLGREVIVAAYAGQSWCSVLWLKCVLDGQVLFRRINWVAGTAMTGNSHFNLGLSCLQVAHTAWTAIQKLAFNLCMAADTCLGLSS